MNLTVNPPAAARVGLEPEAYADRVALGLRHCGRCREWKDGALFHASRVKVFGVQGYCKPCRRAKDRERRQAGQKVR